MRLVVVDWKKEIGDKLIELGFTYGVHITWHKEYGLHKRFSIILNPIGESARSVVVGYSDDELEDVEEIDDCCDLSEIYEDLNKLIDAGIIERR